MILPTALLFSFVLISPSWGIMTPREFETFIEPRCFTTDKSSPQPINGQENPLASTLENFIALAEKFEIANPHIALKDELYYFLRNFTYTNIEFSEIGDIVKWTPKDAIYSDIETLWEPDENLRKGHPRVEDPFTDAEKCSLFFMISHSIIRKHREFNEHKAPPKFQTNDTNGIINSNNNNNRWNNDIPFVEADLYPQEQGIVAIKGSVEAVDFGRVLLGAYVGLNQNRRRELNTFERIPQDQIPPQGTVVDPLYILTIAEVIAMSTWRPEAGKRQLLSENGYWKSIPIGSNIDTGKICPMIYRLRDGTEHSYSLASVRGAADGLILGKVSGAIALGKPNIKLSQVLRQYYTRGGFLQSTPDLGDIRASFCNREDLLNKWDEMVKEQIHLFLLLASSSYRNIDDSLAFTWEKYLEIKRKGVFQNVDREIKEYCGLTKTVDNPEDLPLETPLDVIALIKTDTVEENFKKQQLILGSLAKRLQLSYIGSRMTIFTDERYTPSVSKPGTIYLKTVVDETYSSSCAACSVTQLPKVSATRVPEDELILALHQYLSAKEENDTSKYGVNGKVLILFNFEEDVPTGKQSSMQSRLFKALRDLHVGHRDVRVFALGKNPEVLKQYASDALYVLNAFDIAEDEIGNELFKKISSAPGKLQYPKCENGNDEKRAVYEDYITPNSIQHWSMPAKYFYKSFDLKFVFEIFQGDAKICQSRGTANAELQKDTCLDLMHGKPITLKHSNPCKGFDAFTCGPFYFSLLGVNTTTTPSATKEYCDDKLTETKCRTVDQIKFKISHEGIRCSGGMALVAPSLFIAVGLIVSHLLSKFM